MGHRLLCTTEAVHRTPAEVSEVLWHVAVVFGVTPFECAVTEIDCGNLWTEVKVVGIKDAPIHQLNIGIGQCACG